MRSHVARTSGSGAMAMTWTSPPKAPATTGRSCRTSPTWPTAAPGGRYRHGDEWVASPCLLLNRVGRGLKELLARRGVAVRWCWCPDAGLLSRRAGGSLSRHIYAAVERDGRRHGAGMGCLTILIVGPDWSWTPGFACAVRVPFSDSGLTPMRGRNGAALRFCG